MAFLRYVGAVAAGLLVSAPGWAHGGFSMPAPVHIQAGHALGSHSQGVRVKAGFKATLYVNGVPQVMPEQEVSEVTVLAVPSDAERYRAAFGGVLPAAHSNILLPPVTPHGDYTYLWENNGPQ